MKVSTNVKINLGLSVLRRRDDGYHDIETLFVPCHAYGDDLQIEPAADGRTELELVGADWPPEQDLTLRAWRLLADEFGIPAVKIRLEKHAPVGAGLGSGSCDAAFALRMLSGLFSLGLDDSALAAYAARLGSDCAFFVYNRPMLGKGRGEVLSSYDINLSSYRLEVALPEGCHVSTKDAYSGIVPRERMEASLVGVEDALRRPVSEWKDCLVNDFEATVFPLYPQIAELKADFYQRGAVYASMSGSGSAVFGIFEK